MIFWVGILVGGVFAWLAVRMGFFETWAMLFNIIISVYLGILLGPMLVEIIPGAAGTPYSKVLGMISAAIVAFLILHCISYTFFTGQLTMSFPGIFNSLGAAFLGFLAGFLVWSFAILLVCMTPVSKYDIVKGLGFGGSSQQTSISYMSWWCDLVHKAAASEGDKITCQERIRELLDDGQRNSGENRG
jgi:hypothetical protein